MPCFLIRSVTAVGKKDHFATVCRNKPSKQVKCTACKGNDDSYSDSEFVLQMKKVQKTNNRRMSRVHLNDTPVRIQLDTTDVSVISEKIAHKIPGIQIDR